MRFQKRRGVSEIVGVLLMLAVVVALGVLFFTFASGSMNSFAGSYANAMSIKKSATGEKFQVEQVAFNFGSPGGTLAIDSPATTSFSTGSSALFGYSTADSNDIIVVMVSNEDTTNAILRTVSSVSATGLTFVQRSSDSINAHPFSDAEVWWALATSQLSSVDITVTLSGATDDCSIVVFGVNGANTASPWDPNVSVPKVATGTTASIPTVGAVSTSNANDMVLGFTGVLTPSDPSFPTETAGAGFALAAPTQVNGGGTGGSEAAAEYKVVSSLQSSTTIAFGTTTDAADNWIMIGDAIQAAPAVVAGADVYVRNLGTVSSTLAAVYITDLTSGAFVSQSTISTTVNVGNFVEIPRATLAFTPTLDHTYSFTVTSSLGNVVVYDAEAT